MKARVEAMLMTAPFLRCRVIRRAASWVHRKVPRRLVARTRSKAFGERVRKGALARMPALLTSTSGQPSERAVARSQARTSASREISVLWNSALNPLRCSAFSVARPCAALVSAIDTA